MRSPRLRALCPHTAHGELTPSEFALQWTSTHQPQVPQRLDHQTGPPQQYMDEKTVSERHSDNPTV